MENNTKLKDRLEALPKNISKIIRYIPTKRNTIKEQNANYKYDPAP